MGLTDFEAFVATASQLAPSLSMPLLTSSRPKYDDDEDNDEDVKDDEENGEEKSVKDKGEEKKDGIREVRKEENQHDEKSGLKPVM